MAISGTSEQRSGPIRLGMVGGGKDAFIGAVHRIAARLDDEYRLVAGALSSTPERSLESGLALGLDRERIYGSFQEMAEKEAAREDGIEAVAIVTPNHMHFPAAQEFLKRGIHVICDKPMTSTLEDAEKLAELARSSDALFVLTHNYTGYPMIRQAREMIANGELGSIRVVQAEYVQDWLTVAAEDAGSKQAEWRTDPARSGAGGAIGDIGTHAFNLLSFVTDLKTEELAAELHRFVPGRRVDDNAHIMLRLEGGARGMLWASQVAPGNENGLKLRIYGDKGGLEWFQEEPNKLWFTPFGEPKRLITRNGAGAGPAAARMSRIPSGHPEGYLEAFATLYSQFAAVIRGEGADFEALLPSLADGVEGMQFIVASVQSSQNDSKWTRLSDVLKRALPETSW